MCWPRTVAILKVCIGNFSEFFGGWTSSSKIFIQNALEKFSSEGIASCIFLSDIIMTTNYEHWFSSVFFSGEKSSEKTLLKKKFSGFFFENLKKLIPYQTIPGLKTQIRSFSNSVKSKIVDASLPYVQAAKARAFRVQEPSEPQLQAPMNANSFSWSTNPTELEKSVNFLASRYANYFFFFKKKPNSILEPKPFLKS